jgi:hypothetical protein
MALLLNSPIGITGNSTFMNSKQEVLTSQSFEEAISYRVRTRVFEILGYTSLLQEELDQNANDNLLRIEELCKSLLYEINSAIDYFNRE